MSSPSQESQPLQANLGVWDAIAIIVGIVIGASIFKVPWLIFANVPNPWMGLGVWVFGGLLALIGALCYAELATTYPRSGGDYEYLRKAFGSAVAFLFGWGQLVVVIPASVGAMAYVFAEFATQVLDLTRFWDPGVGSQFMYAILAVVVITVLNVVGVTLGKTTQNVLSVAKLLGLASLVVAACVVLFTKEDPLVASTSTVGLLASPLGQGPVLGAATLYPWRIDVPAPWPKLESSGLGWGGLAMILVLYAFGGWNDAAFVAAEVRDRKRNLPRALVLGVAAITLVYVLVNLAYILGLGFENANKYGSLPAVLMFKAFGKTGLVAISVIVMVSALGAVNGLIFTGSRVYATLGADHRLFGILGSWNRLLGTPVWALLLQMVICIGFIIAISSKIGHDAVNTVLLRTGLVYQPPEWDPDKGFDSLFAHSAPVFWIFFLLTGLSLFKLREKNPDRERPFSVPWYPLTPVIFCTMCMYMLYQSVIYVQWRSLVCIGLVLLGLPLFWLSRLLGKPATSGQGYGEAQELVAGSLLAEREPT